MNKTDLAAKVAAKTGLTKKAAEEAVNATFVAIEEELLAGGRVQIIGFGAFEVRARKPRQGRNPQKPEDTVMIPASKAPVFKAGQALKDKINNN